MHYRIFAFILGACLLGLPAHAQQVRMNPQPMIGNAIPVVPLNAEICPDGTPAVAIITPICQEPLEGSCTAYWCTDPITGNQFLLSRRSGLPNPECRYADMQTEPCSNDITLEERYLPTREDFVKTMPMLYPKDYLTTPLLPPDKW